jgi:hypothetical protein
MSVSCYFQVNFCYGSLSHVMKISDDIFKLTMTSSSKSCTVLNKHLPFDAMPVPVALSKE